MSSEDNSAASNRAAEPDTGNERLTELPGLDLLSGRPEERFDRFTRLAARIFDVSAAMILLVDENRQWLKSRFGFRLCDTSREIALCRYTLEHGRRLIVEDTQDSPLFENDRHADAEANIRFYAGSALRTGAGRPGGALCIIDHKPRRFEEREQQTLADLARLIEEEIRLNDALAEARSSVTNLVDRDASLPGATHTIAYEHIDSLLADAAETNRAVGVFHLSIDNLYDLGIAYGAETTQRMISGWLDTIKRNNADLIYIARLSEKTFVGALQCDCDTGGVLQRCEKLRAQAGQETRVDNISFAFNTTAGLCLYKDQGERADEMVARAKLAHANQSWASQTSIFSPAFAKRFRRQSMLRSRFETAVDQDAVHFHWQPIYTNEPLALAGFELLVRWHDPEMGDISPAEFIPVIDPEERLRRSLVVMALDTACRHIAQWCSRGTEPIPLVSINIPGGEFYRNDFCDLVQDTMAMSPLIRDKI